MRNLIRRTFCLLVFASLGVTIRAEGSFASSVQSDQAGAIGLNAFEDEVRRAADVVGLDCEPVELFLDGFRKANANRLVPFPEWRFAVLDSLYQQKVPYPVARALLSNLAAVPVDTGFLAQLRQIQFVVPATLKSDPAVHAPRVISQPVISFTDAARVARVQGLIVIRCVVLEDGSVANCKLLRGLGYGMDEAAILTVQNRWRFEPATKAGTPVAVEANIEIETRLY